MFKDHSGSHSTSCDSRKSYARIPNAIHVRWKATVRGKVNVEWMTTSHRYFSHGNIGDPKRDPLDGSRDGAGISEIDGEIGSMFVLVS
eukprot:3432047-Amphidinium_carterae.1